MLVAVSTAAAPAVVRAQTAGGAFSLDFVWGNMKLCTPVEGTSPSFFLTDTPKSTARIEMTLRSDRGREVSGGVLSYKPSGSYPAGTFFMRAPCDPGDYTWTAVALDAQGTAVATASKTKPLP